MRQKLLLLLLVIAAFAAGLFSYPYARKVKGRLVAVGFIPGDDTRLHRWGTRFKNVVIPSSFDTSRGSAFRHVISQSNLAANR